MISIFVTINIKPGFKDAFIDSLMGDAQGSVRDEAGCYRFDVLQSDEEPNRLHLYEVYADQDALAAHREAPHYVKWRSTVAEWFDGDPERIATTTIFPSDDGWREQKPRLVNW